MHIIFNEPLLLLILPVLVILFYGIGKRKGVPYTFADKLFLFLRSLVVAILVFALSGISLFLETDVTTTIFAVDHSASVRGQQEWERQWISQAEQEKSKKDLAGIVCFGEHAVVEISPRAEFSQFAFNAYVNDGATSLEKAIAVSASLFDQKTKKRIVLLSDGIETVGDGLAQAKIAKGQGITIDVYPLENALEKEVQLSRVEIPPYINKHAVYTIAVQVDSLKDTTGTLKVYEQNTLIVEEEVRLKVGENQFAFSNTAETGGSLTYRAEILSEDDTMAENNAAYGFCYIEDVPAVMVVEQENSGSEMAKILEASGLAVTRADAAGVPSSPETLSQFDAIILANVPYPALQKPFPEALKQYVQHIGGGLLMTGGEASFALGEYYNTELEEILPVSMDLRTQKDNPNVGMVMVIDHSGSMSDVTYGMPIMELAKEAAIRGVEGLADNDYVGVLAFDMVAEWAAPFQMVSGRREAIAEAVGKIQPDGGTSILPALDQAYRTLLNANTKLKHIILLTDGQAEQTGYEAILAGMQQNGITLSAIAVGSGADTALLERLAEGGGGRFYFTDGFTDLPQIFIKEAFLAGREYINNRTFFPEAGTPSPILADITAVPPLDGYIATTAKPRADLALQSDTGDPILAAWQYGLGRTAAFTSDIKGQWSKSWLQSEEGLNIFRNTISWILRGEQNRQISISGERIGTEGLITVSMPFDETVKTVSATVFSQDGASYGVELKALSPGIYQGRFPHGEEGAYLATVEWTKEDGAVENSHGGFLLPYGKEYDIRYFGNGESLLKNIAALTGGKVLSNAKDLFYPLPEMKTMEKDLTNILLAIAFFLFLLDIAARRFSIIPEKAEAWRIKLGAAWNRDKKKPVLKRDQETQGKIEKSTEEVSEPGQVEHKGHKTEKEERSSVDTASRLAEMMKKRKQK